jgi:hypothetical protein
MKGTGKFITAVFVILFVVLMGELGYILYSSSQSKNTPKDQPVPTLTIEQVETLETKQINETQAINDDMLVALAKANRGVLISSVLEIMYQGNVTELTVDGDGMKIRITGTTGESNAFFYPPDQMTKLSFFSTDSITKETKPITASQLAIGDLVRIEGKMDMLEDLKVAFKEGKITVLAK